MSRHRKRHQHRKDRPGNTGSDSRSYRYRSESKSHSFTIGAVFAASRLGVQGRGHPPADAPFEERLAPYAGLVDSFLRGSVEQLGDNVDVSYMKADFQRFVAERMLLSGMNALLGSNASSARCSELIEELVGLVEKARYGRRGEFHGPNLRGPAKQALRDHASMIPGALQCP